MSDRPDMDAAARLGLLITTTMRDKDYPGFFREVAGYSFQLQVLAMSILCRIEGREFCITPQFSDWARMFGHNFRLTPLGPRAAGGGALES